MIRKYGIVIVSWNASDVLIRCLESVVEAQVASVDAIFKVVVIDNCSSDDSCKKVAQNFPGVRLIRSDVNLGFGRACNIAATEIRSEVDYLLFLNPDVVLQSNTLRKLDSVVDSKGRGGLGVLSIALQDSYGRLSVTTYRFPNLRNYFGHITGLDRIFASFKRHLPQTDESGLVKVDQVIGAFFLVPCDLFFELEGFDSRFFVYYEEVDFCKRISNLGLDVVYVSSIKAMHIGGVSSSKIPVRRTIYSLQSKYEYFKKWGSPPSFVFFLFLFSAVEPLSRLIVTLRKYGVLAGFKAWFQIYKAVFMYMCGKR